MIANKLPSNRIFLELMLPRSLYREAVTFQSPGVAQRTLGSRASKNGYAEGVIQYVREMTP